MVIRRDKILLQIHKKTAALSGGGAFVMNRSQVGSLITD
jgi:hypothetical protein